MSWIVIVGALAFVFGSFMMLKPNARDSRLAKLRFDAVKEGLLIRQFKWESTPKKTGIYEPINTTSYTLQRPFTSKSGELKFAIVAQKGWETEHLPDGFSWHHVGTFEQADHFAQLLPQLQDELLLLEVWDNKVLLMAKETPTATAAAYKHFLEAFL